ncbi:hypothetical protein LOTGIDRAFT_167270 [Lottia gigantea]|uniref:Uncharacterized protein n=1 Tax=Lottia gigantea TaxID=225164 RepID=V3ZV58_LOTGI|nr:hypothetical protein LOTGIDRAFT_167270 [Lottia gigantea]ESO86455.1 hypothetical protein LOTGIDRAFT_167270 [Lottia gigantea]
MTGLGETKQTSYFPPFSSIRHLVWAEPSILYEALPLRSSDGTEQASDTGFIIIYFESESVFDIFASLKRFGVTSTVGIGMILHWMFSVGCLSMISSTLVLATTVQNIDNNNAPSTQCSPELDKDCPRGILDIKADTDRDNVMELVRKILTHKNRGNSEKLTVLENSSKNDKQPAWILKRPKFNPTGWRRRRKRSISGLPEWNSEMGNLLNNRFDSGDNELFGMPSLFKRVPNSNGNRRLAFLRSAYKLKRKPLKFNPTGW